MSESLLELSDVDAGYGDKQVLHDISLRVRPGESVALIGPNGSGKSTLLKVAFGLLAPRAGRVSFDGGQLEGPSDSLSAGVVLLPQGSRVFPGLSVQENLQIGGHDLPGQELHRRSEEVLALFPALHDRLATDASRLSGGEQQMVALARALMRAPRMLLLDEPSLGLAPAVLEEVVTKIAKIRERLGAALLWVEQKVDVALARCERVYGLRLGRITLEGPCDNVTKDQLEKLFL